jgi:hypothetical protein
VEDAEPGTPEEYDSEEAGEPSLNDELNQLPPKVVELIADMYSELGELRAAVAAQQDTEPNEFTPAERTPLPEGTRRYWNEKYTEETLIRIPGRTLMIDGEKIYQPQLDIPFMKRIYTTSDPDEISFIENHEAFNVYIWRADDALPDLGMPGLSTGVRDSTSTPRGNPLAAPMG